VISSCFGIILNDAVDKPCLKAFWLPGEPESAVYSCHPACRSALLLVPLAWLGYSFTSDETFRTAKISTTKNGKDRKADLSKQLTGVLNELLSHRRSEALRREMERPAEERRDSTTVINEVMDDWLFKATERAEKRGRRPSVKYPRDQINPSCLRRLFDRLFVDARLRRVRFHDLRHSHRYCSRTESLSPTSRNKWTTPRSTSR